MIAAIVLYLTIEVGCSLNSQSSQMGLSVCFSTVLLLFVRLSDLFHRGSEQFAFWPTARMLSGFPN